MWLMIAVTVQYSGLVSFCSGVLSITSLNRLSEMSRINRDYFSVHHPGGVFFLMFGRHWTFSPVLFGRAAVDLPMIFHSSISRVGRTSIDICQTLQDEKDKTLLASLAFRIVNIDPEARGAAVPIPQSVLEEARKRTVAGGAQFPRIDPPSSLPQRVFTIQIKVRYDDMDFLFHTNQSSYLEFALECAATAAESGFYSVIHDDIAFYHAKQTTSVNLEESRVGDELTVSTWEDDNNKMLLNFAVNKAEQIIYYARIEFCAK